MAKREVSPRAATGASPAGAPDEPGAALAVRAMFDGIAPRYDLLNHVLSLNIDRLWWWRAARRFRTVLRQPNAHVLDICCGTGDMTLALLRHRPAGAAPILAADFAHNMLVRGAEKFGRRSVAATGGAVAIEADALALPVRDGALHLITSAFGFRNLANYRAGLGEFFRALAPGGELGILDFSEPDGLLGKLYGFYFRRVLPTVGSWLSGDRAAYIYLPTSVQRFPAPPLMLAMMREAGFTEVTWTPYQFGIAGLFQARKPL